MAKAIRKKGHKLFGVTLPIEMMETVKEISKSKQLGRDELIAQVLQQWLDQQ